MNKEEFYRRQKILKEVGENGQELLERASVLIIGAGGLGHPVASYLAGSGVGHIGICDFDKVEPSNLHRQVLFNLKDVGEYKSTVLTKIIKNQNPFIRVTEIRERINLENAESFLHDFDIVVDCCDNFETKFLLHDLCYILEKDLIQSSIYQFEGQLQKFNYSSKDIKKSGCLRCLWNETPKKDCVGSCATAGVIGAVAGVFGSLQAMEVIKSILGIEGLKHRQTMIFDLISLEQHKVSWKHKDNCNFCSVIKSVKDLKEEKSIFEVSHVLDRESSVIVDIRESDEISRTPLNHRCVVNSMSKFDETLINSDKDVILVCETGARSFKLANQLRESGYKNVFSLSTGRPGLG
jgi:adenylyltransferase/sulfurtransferase